MSDVTQAVEVAAADPNVQLVMSKLEQFCSGLGMKVEQFFPYLIKQQEVIFYTGFIKLFISLFLASICIMIFYKIMRNIHSLDRKFDPDIYLSDVARLIISVVAGLIGVIAIISGVVYLFDTPSLIGRTINPEFYAVQQAMEIASNLLK